MSIKQRKDADREKQHTGKQENKTRELEKKVKGKRYRKEITFDVADERMYQKCYLNNT